MGWSEQRKREAEASSVRNLGEVVFAGGLLPRAERAVVGGGCVQVAPLQATPEHGLVAATAKRRAHHVRRRLAEVAIAVNAVIHYKVGGEHLADGNLVQRSAEFNSQSSSLPDSGCRTMHACRRPVARHCGSTPSRAGISAAQKRSVRRAARSTEQANARLPLQPRDVPAHHRFCCTSSASAAPKTLPASATLADGCLLESGMFCTPALCMGRLVRRTKPARADAHHCAAKTRHRTT